MEKRLWTGPEVCDATGVSYRQLDYWDRTGVVKPTRRALGSGTQRGYTLDEVVAVALVGAVTEGGGGLPDGALDAATSGLDLILARASGQRSSGPHRKTSLVAVADLDGLLGEFRQGPAFVVDLGPIRVRVMERLLAKETVAA